MTRALLLLASMCLPLSSSAAERIANCKAPEGYARYHFTGGIAEKDSGFTDDAISDGIFSLVRLADNEFDVLFLDSTGSIRSTVQDGGLVRLARASSREATFLVIYPEISLEIYSFYTETDDAMRFDILQSRGGSALVHKSSLLSGTCSQLELGLVDN